MLTHPTLDQLKALKLDGMADPLWSRSIGTAGRDPSE